MLYVRLEERYSRYFFFSSRRRHTRSKRDWSSDVCSSDLAGPKRRAPAARLARLAALAQGPAWPPAAQCQRTGPIVPRGNVAVWNIGQKIASSLWPAQANVASPEKKISLIAWRPAFQ